MLAPRSRRATLGAHVPKILVADDDQQLAELVRTTLADAGYEVTVASTGREAWRATADGSIDLAILDVLMPGISGDAIAADLQRARPELPVLLITGASGTQFTAGSRIPIVRKPFAPERLLEEVRRLLA